MIKKLISFSILLVIAVFALANFITKRLSNCNQLSVSLLDSLQGNWALYDDNLSKFRISGRNLLMYYDQGANSIQPDDSYRIYFSDTVTGEGEDFSTLTGIDTTATSGEYLIRVQNQDNSYSSFRINGFHQNQTESTFSMTATFTMGSSINFLYKKE
ncbi:MAG: hypothetical protein C0459_08285 [Chitinophaga sp.]|jgi:hypothetical protein|nr:hypothetical protein [Chitinophaga sp.]